MDDKKVELSPLATRKESSITTTPSKHTAELRRIFIILNRDALPILKANRFKMGTYLEWAFRLKQSLSALFKMGA